MKKFDLIGWGLVGVLVLGVEGLRGQSRTVEVANGTQEDIYEKAWPVILSVKTVALGNLHRIASRWKSRPRATARRVVDEKCCDAAARRYALCRRWFSALSSRYGRRFVV